MAGRSVPEWIGKTADTKIPPRVRLRVFDRCGGRCQITGKKIWPGDKFEIDHITALANGGENRESNLQLVLKAAHREKTSDDVRSKAKANRLRAKHFGIGPAKKKGRFKRKISGQVVDRETGEPV